MSDIFNEISQKYKLFSTHGVKEDEIIAAEERLGLKFSKDFRDYLQRYGAISFGSTELTGLNIEKYANVVEVTLKEMNRNNSFPKNSIVIENIGVEGLLVLQNTNGEVYEWKDGKVYSKYQGFADYIKSKL